MRTLVLLLNRTWTLASLILCFLPTASCMIKEQLISSLIMPKTASPDLRVVMAFSLALKHQEVGFEPFVQSWHPSLGSR